VIKCDQIRVLREYGELVMIRVHLKALLEEKSFQEKRRITLNEVSEKTGVSRYFACTPCDLLEFIEETGEENYR
jgi:hypothetical protein